MQITNNVQWWKAEGSTASNRAIAMITAINNASVGFHNDNLRHTRMYENRDYFGTAISSHMVRTYSQARRSNYNNKQNRMALNITKSCIDTLVSKLGKERVKPVYLTTGGMIERREKCEKLNQWLYGMFHETGFYETCKQDLRYACIYGKGGRKTYITMKDGKPCIVSESVFTPEILVDPYDAYYGDPMCLYQQKFVTKDFLRTDPVLGKNSKAIDSAMGLSSLAGSSAHDTTIVWEAWRKKSELETGKHLIFTDAGVLFEEDWHETEHVIDFLDYTTPVTGFWGVGVCEELIPIQVEINRISNYIRDCMILGSNPRTYVPIGANIDKNHLTNRINGIVPFAGSQPPIQMAPPSVNPELFGQLENLYRKGFEIVGLNMMSASGRNTLGASASGEAIRSYNDIETERFAELQQNWEDYAVRIAKRMHRMAKKIVKDYGHYEIHVVHEEKGVGSIDFADIDIPDNSYDIQSFPQSALPQQPGFRFATIKEWKDEQYIDQDDARELMGFPDLKSKTKYILAPKKIVERIVEKIAYQPTPKGSEGWVTFIPEPYMPLSYCILMGSQMYNYLGLELPEKTDAEIKEKKQRMNLIRNWIDKSVELDRMSKSTGQMQPSEVAQIAAEPPSMPAAPVGMPQQALGGGMAMAGR